MLITSYIKKMFDKEKHKLVMVRILKDIYRNVSLGKVLGFKGGTMAYLFYDLPRESVDLDFDLLDRSQENVVFEGVKSIIGQYGKVTESIFKKNTIFFLLDYGFEERKLKVEITRIKTRTDFEVKSYLGIPMLIMNRSAMVASKLLALANRTKLARRDVFDIWYFLKNNWEIDDKVIENKGDLTTKQVIEKAIKRVEKIKENEILFGLGDLLDNSTKFWVKDNLKREAILELRMRLKK